MSKDRVIRVLEVENDKLNKRIAELKAKSIDCPNRPASKTEVEMAKRLCDYQDEVQRLKERIDELVAENKKHRWIPVSERLPEDVFPCLVTNGRDSVVTYYADLRGTWIADHYDVLKLKQYGKITYWKPIVLP